MISSTVPFSNPVNNLQISSIAIDQLPPYQSGKMSTP